MNEATKWVFIIGLSLIVALRLLWIVMEVFWYYRKNKWDKYWAKKNEGLSYMDIICTIQDK